MRNTQFLKSNILKNSYVRLYVKHKFNPERERKRTLNFEVNTLPLGKKQNSVYEKILTT